ncbi:MAG: isoleucine--tRNA ligase [Gaiellaceae bacterium]
MDRPFQPLAATPDHVALEQEILEWWDAERVFDRLRERNRGGPIFSFIDGPVTANKSLAVHTAWGRTLKDVFQRYRALRGFDQRYQNGFDCQGLWIEVGVERELGLNSKREIEEYGLEAFARRCRDVVVRSATELTQGCKRLGQWMDWGNDYYTFSDTNIEYIWKFLKIVHQRGWLYRGHRSTEWCPRCGTSISAHELAGSYVDRADPSLFVRLPLVDRPGESLVVWTTTPWTLPANVAAAVHPEAEYGRRVTGEWVGASRYPDERLGGVRRGTELVGWRYRGPFDELGPGSGVDHRVIPWREVSLEEGTGIVHIAPGCGGEDFELAHEFGLSVLTPVDESGRFYDGYGWLHGLSTVEAAEQIIGNLEEKGRVVEAGLHEHRYPECWRCHTPLIFRIADDWFISVGEIREPMRAANADVEWTPDYFGKRMDDWLVNMGDWNISRRRYYGLPLPFYSCSCGELNVIGSRAELGERATGGLDGLEELRRPWIDRVAIRCAACGEAVERIPEVGDVWLDAGIVPFSTLGWENSEWIPQGYATGAARGLTRADLPDHAYWETWFPANWVTEMREQIRLWFYSQLLMSVVLTGRAPFERVLGYEKMLDENGREMHGSWGNMIDAEDAFARMGADVMRWQYCSQPPTQNLLFGFGPADEIKRRLQTLWHSVKFFVDYANVEGFRPDWSTLEPEGELRPLDRWLIERAHAFVNESTAGYDAYLTVDVIRAYESFVDDLSNWYIRRSRRRFWEGDATALRVLWFALVQTLRMASPVMPFLTEHLWRNLVAGVCPDAPLSIHLVPWPGARPVDRVLLEEVAEVRLIVELGRQARAQQKITLRQPLHRLFVSGARHAQGLVDELREELRVREVVFQDEPPVRFTYKPNLRVLGPRLGKGLPVVQRALAAGDFELLPDGGLHVAGHDLEPDDLIVERSEEPGWAHSGTLSVGIDTTLDDELKLEKRVLDLIHRLNTMRKEAGLKLTDRIVVTLPRELDDLLRHEERIKQETLAVEIRVDGIPEPQIAEVA